MPAPLQALRLSGHGERPARQPGVRAPLRAGGSGAAPRGPRRATAGPGPAHPAVPQAHEMVLRGYVPTSEETLQTLAALRLQSLNSDFSTHAPFPRLEELFPPRVLRARLPPPRPDVPRGAAARGAAGRGALGALAGQAARRAGPAAAGPPAGGGGQHHGCHRGEVEAAAGRQVAFPRAQSERRVGNSSSGMASILFCRDSYLVKYYSTI